MEQQMTKTKHNVLILQEPSADYDISWRAGIMYLNRFCIDEEAGNEISGVYRSNSKPRLSDIPTGKFTDGKRRKEKARDSHRKTFNSCVHNFLRKRCVLFRPERD